LVIGVPVLLLVCVLSALTDNWTWLLYASPIVVLCLALALVLLLKRPDEPDELDDPDESDDGAGRAAPLAFHLRR
jgi:hypothetical protein